ncbi:uncharacterized protein LOC120290646 [Eucalyptus grandis]|uniref:uncharacterized protein LOC120290646 n=1 Tax=Eucalyptus grandis TaxID=71139 RepID=UPI00192EA0F7|nr:uncharacterized protein LOC120290646 [Eucalyptus grandis]
MATRCGHVIEYHTDCSDDNDVEGCEEVNYSMYDSRRGKDAESAEEDGFPLIDLDDDGSMERDMEIGDISLYVDVLADNADFLNKNSENEYTHPEFNAKVDMENPTFKLGMCFSNVKEFREAVRNHAIKNGRKVRGVELKKLLWKAAMATRVCDFDLAMAQLKAVDEKAYDWLSQRPSVQWSKSYFRTNSKCDISLNNWCESFNKSIIDARDKPIITMLETIRAQLMERIHKQRDGMTKYTGVICPNIQKILDLQKQFSISWIPTWNGEDEFELSGPYGDKRVVNIRHRSCSCRRWDISGIPCCHAVAALIYIREEPEKWVHTSFSKKTFMQIYSHVVHVVDSKDTWPAREPLLPPDVPKQVKRRMQGPQLLSGQR